MKKLLTILFTLLLIMTAACSTDITTGGGLVIEDLKVGSGEAAEDGDVLEVHYVGTLEDGTKFDSSRDRDDTFEFTLGAGEVIKGWDVGMQGMQVGGIRELTIPSNIAYGDRAKGNIPADSTLIFEVELIDIK